MVEQGSFLPAAEAAQLAGVTVDTIRQFAKFGLVRTAEENAEPRYNEADLRNVFRLPPRSAVTSSNDVAGETASASVAPPASEPEATTSPSANAETPPVIPEQPASTNHDVARTTPVQVQTSSHAVQPDVSHAYELLEFTRSLRDQIEMLREERDWLRRRLEKVEDRTERDQMLLLSQGETVRHLVDQQNAQRGFWSRALPWFKKPR